MSTTTETLEHRMFDGTEEKSTTPLLHGDEEQMEIGSGRGSESPKVSRNKKMALCLGITMITTVALLLVTFFAIIPAIMQDVTDDEDISMNTVTIYDATEDDFHVTSSMAFSDKPILPATVKMHNTKLSWQGTELAMMTHNNKLHVSTNEQTLSSNVLISDVQAMTDFNVFLMGAESFDWDIHGHADAIALSDKVDVVVDKPLTMKGFNSFPQDPVIETVSVYEGTTEFLYSLSTTILFSPSNIEMIFGKDMLFDLMSNGIKVGTGTIPDSSFITGEFSVDATIAMAYGTPKETAEMNFVCGQFISQIPTDVTMENFRLVEPISWLVPALSTISLKSVLPPVQEGVMDSLDMYLYLGDILNVQWGGHFYNPLDTSMTLYSMVCDIYYEDVSIARVDEPDIEIYIPSKTHIISEVDMYAKTIVAHTTTVLELVKNKGGPLDLDCQIKNTIGDYMVNLNYRQNDVPSTIHQGRPPKSNTLKA